MVDDGPSKCSASCSSVVDGRLTLSVPRHYTALTGDFLVAFTTNDNTPLNSTDWYIDVIESRDTGQLSPLTTVNIPGGYSDGEISIGCGVIDVAGQLVVRLVVDRTSSRVVTQSIVVDVLWSSSSLTLRLTDSHQALSDDLPVTLTVDPTLCQSRHSNVFYTLQLLYLASTTNTSSVIQAPHNTVVFTQTLAALRTPASPIVVPCSLIDRAGLYQAWLVSSRRSDVPIAKSNVLAVHWSDHYSLSVSSASKSCRKPVLVRHTQPRCDNVFYTLRVLVPSHIDQLAPGRDVTASRSRDWRYVAERRVKSSDKSVTFNCALFQYTEQCVVFFSTAADNTVHVHQRSCTSPPTHQLRTGYIYSSSSPSCCRPTCNFMCQTIGRLVSLQQSQVR